MNQKQKIIILLSSFLCGSPIIFLSWKDNNQQKNNLSLKKEKKKENQKEKEKINKKENESIINHQENKSSSFFFWIMVIVIIVFLIIIGIATYRYLSKNKNDNQDNNTDKANIDNQNINPDFFAYNPLSGKKEQLKPDQYGPSINLPMNNMKNDSKQSNGATNEEKIITNLDHKDPNNNLNNSHDYDENEEKEDPLKQKKSLKLGLFTTYCLEQKDFGIIFSKDPAYRTKMAIKDLLNIGQKCKELNSFFYDQAPDEYLNQFFKMTVNFLEKYLTFKLLNDVYSDTPDNKKKYGTLDSMATKLISSKNDNNVEILKLSFVLQENEGCEATDQDMKKINVLYKHQDLLIEIMNRKQITFIKDKHDKKYYLYASLFKFNQIIKIIFNNILTFLQKHQAEENYSSMLKDFQKDKDNFDNYFLKKDE